MKITIITATYNNEKTIKSCLLSVVRQSYESIEYVIIDGGSNDETLNIIKRFKFNYQNILFKIISESDKGIYDALNKGISEANGDIIGFVHSDDILASEEILQQIVDEFKKNKIDGVYGDLQYVSHSNLDDIIRYWKSKPFNYQLLKTGWMPAHPTLFLKKFIYKRYGGFDTSYKISADYNFMLAILKNPDLKFGYLSKVITKMRVGGASNRNLKNIIRKTKEDYRAIRYNEIGGLLTLILKNTSKIKQFFVKY